jgi:hypothetical protein
MEAEMEDATDGSQEGTELGVATAVESNDFTAHATFLVIEGEGDEGRRLDLGVGAGRKVETALTNKELHVSVTKRSSIGRRDSVFARSEEEEEGKGNHVSNG